MEKKCAHCGKIFHTEYPTKLYCSVECSKKAYLERDISGYDDLIDPAAEVLFSFECAECGRLVKVTSIYDQRTRFCCGKCAYQNKLAKSKQRLAKLKYSSNLGMTSAMSLVSLMRRESRSVDNNPAIYVNTCPICGKKFESKKANKIYCSSVCKNRAKDRRRIKGRE